MSEIKTPTSIHFFANGLVISFDENGQQLVDLQKKGLHELYFEWVESLGVNPMEIKMITADIRGKAMVIALKKDDDNRWLMQFNDPAQAAPGHLQDNDGLLSPGNRVEKCNSNKNEMDGHRDGDKATILTVCVIEAIKRPLIKQALLAATLSTEHIPKALYFVLWDDLPNIPAAVADYRVRRI